MPTENRTDIAVENCDHASLRDRYARVRQASTALCATLSPEDMVVQSMADVSPTKWHLAHTTWFFETFVLAAADPSYRTPDARYAVLFNSYYNSIGEQFERPRRGLLTRPSVAEVMAYRRQVDQHLGELLAAGVNEPLADVIEIGLHHEQQHQELMLMDIKHVLSQNPLWPAYREISPAAIEESPPLAWLPFEEDLHWIGHDGAGFAFDNETPRHREFVEGFDLANRLVTCGEYLEFIEDDGYRRPELWLSDGWSAVQQQGWRAPLYWEQGAGDWRLFTLAGMQSLNPSEPVAHVSYFEADAFARWAGARLPTEAAWEVAAADRPTSGNFVENGNYHPRPANNISANGSSANGAPAQLFGDLWEWTASPYVAYPGYRPAEGALGEYNGKFMSGQMILRGGCCATPADHIRPTYRNFFPPSARWPFTGIRLAKDL
jgi:ergothioneine biosynthesis protein EgtB